MECCLKSVVIKPHSLLRAELMTEQHHLLVWLLEVSVMAYSGCTDSKVFLQTSVELRKMVLSVRYLYLSFSWYRTTVQNSNWSVLGVKSVFTRGWQPNEKEHFLLCQDLKYIQTMYLSIIFLCLGKSGWWLIWLGPYAEVPSCWVINKN